MTTSKDPIKLRRRKMPSGRESLYLDIYVNGRRSYEYLKLYIVPEKTKEDKEKNRQTLRLAEAVRAKKLVDLQNGRFGFEKIYHEDELFLPFFESCMNRWEKKDGKGNYACWHSTLCHLKIFLGRKQNITFRDITPEWIEGFKDYLDNEAVCQTRKSSKGELSSSDKLKKYTKEGYFNKLRACINRAYEMKMIPENPIKGIQGFSVDRYESERCYLTLDELKSLVATPCEDEMLRRAFLFSCLTGLRKSDIEALTWGEVFAQGDMTRIIFRQKKTKGLEYLDLSPEAVKYMGEPKSPKERVFAGWVYSTTTNPKLRLWASRAGIDKHITFHSGRHTFAVLMLDLDVDVFTVSKLLGHREIRTTQIYAKVLDKNKQAAVMRIPDLEM